MKRRRINSSVLFERKKRENQKEGRGDTGPSHQKGNPKWWADFPQKLNGNAPQT